MEVNNEIKAIIFDIGNVLIPINFDGVLNKLKALSRLKRMSLSGTEIFNIFMKDPSIDLYESGKISTDEFLLSLRQKLYKCCGIDANIEDIKRYLIDIISKFEIEEEFLKKIKENYILAILSNTNELHINYLKENYNFLKIFDYLFFSYEMQCIKPSKEIYLKVIKELNLSPSSIVFIDDREENIKACNEVGIKGIVYKGKKNLIEQFDKMGVNY